MVPEHCKGIPVNKKCVDCKRAYFRDNKRKSRANSGHTWTTKHSVSVVAPIRVAA